MLPNTPAFAQVNADPSFSRWPSRKSSADLLRLTPSDWGRSTLSSPPRALDVTTLRFRRTPNDL
jgi:hypothetical protein